jgi:endonuclease/exonuclease/phosphatase family metal-dependent hydrolase
MHPAQAHVRAVAALAALLLLGSSAACHSARAETGAGAPSPDPVPSTVTVITLNVCGGKCRQTQGLTAWIDRLARQIRVADADIVLLQEICRQQYTELVRRLESDGSQLAYTGAWNPTLRDEDCAQWGAGPADFGNAMLVRGLKSLSGTRSWKLPNPDGDEARGLLCGTAALRAGRITTCVTHIDYHSAAREAQIPFVAETAVEAGGGGPLILGGDFNAAPNADVLSALYSPPLGTGAFIEFGAVDPTHSQRLDCMGPVVPCRTGSTTANREKIDYIFVTARHFMVSFSAVPGLDPLLSDHQPLLGKALLRAR